MTVIDNDAPAAAGTNLEADLASALAEVRRLGDLLHETRMLGMAAGIITERIKVSIDQASELLEALARRDGVAVLELAEELVDNGRLA